MSIPAVGRRRNSISPPISACRVRGRGNGRWIGRRTTSTFQEFVTKPLRAGREAPIRGVIVGLARRKVRCSDAERIGRSRARSIGQQPPSATVEARRNRFEGGTTDEGGPNKPAHWSADDRGRESSSARPREAPLDKPIETPSAWAWTQRRHVDRTVLPGSYNIRRAKALYGPSAPGPSLHATRPQRYHAKGQAVAEAIGVPPVTLEGVPHIPICAPSRT